MSRYTVLDHSEATREAVLLDAYGKLHLARWSVLRPALGEVMHGPRAALGFHVLSAEISRRAFATDFLLIDCQHALVLVRWAAQQPEAPVVRRAVMQLPVLGSAAGRRLQRRATASRRRRAETPAAALLPVPAA